MDQLKEGLNTLHFLERVKECSDFEMHLVHDQDNCVNGDYVRCQLLPKLSDLNTKSENQEQIKHLASNCLMDISGNFVYKCEKVDFKKVKYALGSLCWELSQYL